MFKYIFCFSIICFFCFKNIDAQDTDIIQKVSKFYQPYLKVHAIWLEKGSSERQYEFFREKNKGKLISEQIRSSNKNATTLSRGEYLTIENKSIIGCLSECDNKKEKVSDDFIFSYVNVPSNKFLSTFANISPGVCMGIIHGKWIPDLLKNITKIEVQTITIEGKEIKILIGNIEEEKINFHLHADPLLDYAVTKIEVEKEYPKQDVSLDGITLDDLPVQIVKNTYIMEDFKKENDKWVPYKLISESQYSPYVSISSTVDAHGKSIVSRDSNNKLVIMPSNTTKTISTLKKIEFNFSFSNKAPFAFTTPIADGTKVHMEDAFHLDFMWKNGKVVPVTDETILALRGQRFIPSPAESRFWLMSVSLLMIILAIGLIIHEYRKLKN
jgi:hypothetical protein